MPLSIVQPFLRGGGRAVTLENLTLAERNLLYEIRSFARFRQEFFVAVLVTGGSLTSVQTRAIRPPAISRSSSFCSRSRTPGSTSRPSSASMQVFDALKSGEAVGPHPVAGRPARPAAPVGPAVSCSRRRSSSRTALDQYKMQFGHAARCAAGPRPPDPGRIPPDTFVQILEWSARDDRELEDLPRFVGQLPKLQEIVIDGREVLEIAGVDADRDPERAKDEALAARSPNPTRQEDLLLAAERVMLENRLDLMNARAQLYDSWRQIRVASNGLLGTFNGLAHQPDFHPHGYDQSVRLRGSGQAVLAWSLNTELPLVRLAERNSPSGPGLDQLRASTPGPDVLRR